MFRLIIILVLLIVLYLMVRTALREYWGRKSGKQTLSGKDVMVQDPVCKTYIPTDSAVTADIGGQTYYFCSRNCAHTFKTQLSG